MNPRTRPPDTATALDPDTPLVWPELGTNRAFTYHFGDKAKTDAAFAKAAKVTRIEFTNNRLVCNYMEPRSAIGEWRADEDRFVLTTGSQGVHSMQIHPGRASSSIKQEAAARHHAGCRRRLRPEELRLPRVSAGAWRPPSGSAGRSNGRATAPSIF